MKSKTNKILFYAVILLAGIFAPVIFPAYTFQLAILWLMILFALTWDILGGQMGYNSLGNILFFGAGMYICTIVQIGMFYDVAEYTAHFGAVKIDFTPYQYYSGLALGLVSAAIASLVFAVIFGWIVLACADRISQSARWVGPLPQGNWSVRGTMLAAAAGSQYGVIRGILTTGHCFFMLFASFQQFALSFFSSGFIPQGFSWHSMPSVMMRKRPKQWEFTPTATRPLPGHSLLFSLAYQGVFLGT